MNHLPQLISDLAIILLCAGVMTVLFKKLKQPVVLGYIVAGFLASPYMPYTPSVADNASISTWADIGVIFLLFSIGLEFSFKKLFKMGSTPFIAVATSVACMICIGLLLGRCFGWSFMNSLYLGGMMAMSSTSIVVKAFDEMGLKQQKFASLVLSVLIIEDIIAIIMMLLFGTLGSGGKVEGGELLLSIGKMVFYLILWFVLGIYLIPLLLRKCKGMLTDETLLIVSLSLCFLMVVLASAAGFSSAFGAFVMGSILSETMESERIERLITPVKNLFGAIFFVSVGMMIDPHMLLRYWLPIVIISLAMIALRSTVDSFGFMLGGTDIKTSIKCGYSLAQMGEFSFIIATLGISLGAIDSFIYPIIVSVSVITTFTTPYMIRLAEPVGTRIEPLLPERMKAFLQHYDADDSTIEDESRWKSMLREMLSPMLIYGVLCIAILVLSFSVLEPLALSLMDDRWARLLTLAVTLLLMAPFLRPLLLKHCFTTTFWQLWNDRHFNRPPLLAIVLFRTIAVVTFIIICVNHYYPAHMAALIGIIVLVFSVLLFSNRIKKRQQKLEEVFSRNLNSKELAAAQQRPRYAGDLQSRDVHLTDIVVPTFSQWAGKTLSELQWGRQYDINVVSIARDGVHINIPGAGTRLFPGDRVQLVGTDEALRAFAQTLGEEERRTEAVTASSSGEMRLTRLAVAPGASVVGRTLQEMATRQKYNCLIVGVDRGGTALLKATHDLALCEGDIVWVVGEEQNLRRLAERAARQ